LTAKAPRNQQWTPSVLNVPRVPGTWGVDSSQHQKKTPVMEHKGLFSGGVVFLAYPPHLQ
jgi:hypothetical protein